MSWETILDRFKAKFWNEKIVLIEKPKSVNDWIEAVRRIFSKVRFDENSCKQGVNCLENYRKKYDEVRKIFLDKPKNKVLIYIKLFF